MVLTPLERSGTVRTNLQAFDGWKLPQYGAMRDINEYWPKNHILSRNLQVDVLIVGAGISGLMAAWAASDQGLKTCVIDNVRPGWNASGRNCGIVSGMSHYLKYPKALRLYGLEQVRQLYAFEQAAMEYTQSLIEQIGHATQKVQCGHYHFATTAREAHGLGSLRSLMTRVFSHPLEWVDRHALYDLGFDEPVQAALYQSQALGVNPLVVLISLINSLRSNGIDVHFLTPMLAWDEQEDWLNVTTPNGSIQAKKLVLACGGVQGSNEHNPLLEFCCSSARSVLITRQLDSDEAGEYPKSLCATLGDKGDKYVRILPNSSLLFSAPMKTGVSDLARARQLVHQEFSTYFPRWRRLEVEQRWESQVSLPKYDAPIVSCIHSNVWACSGWADADLASAAYGGVQVIRLMLGLPTTLPQFMQQSKRTLGFKLWSWLRT